jgi:transcriptional regulator with XRE-family HTH domain
MAKEIGMSQPGFVASLNNESLTVKNLEKLADVFNVPVSYFFEDGNEEKKPCRECDKIEAKLEILKELLYEKEREIAKLNRELGRNLGTGDSEVA